MSIFEKKEKRNSTIEYDGADFGLGERIWTSGLLNPIQARYQTALHPDGVDYDSIWPEKCQHTSNGGGR